MIDNFQAIEDNLLDFKEGSFFKFVAMRRNTDGFAKSENIRSWCIDSLEAYQKSKPTMIDLCTRMGARLYVCLDRKNTRKVLAGMLVHLGGLSSTEIISSRTDLSISTLMRIANSTTSAAKSTDKEGRMWLFDIDSDNFELLAQIQAFCYPHKFFTLATKKGWHVCVSRSDLPRPDTKIGSPIETDYPYLWQHKSEWTVLDNAMGLVYYADKVTTSV